MTKVKKKAGAAPSQANDVAAGTNRDAGSASPQLWELSRLVPYARNPRKNDAVVDRMCSSIREFGFKVPCLVRSDGEVVDGHLRLKAALKLGISEVPVILCDEWTAAQVKAFRLLVNRSVNWADWDDDLVALEMEDLKGLDFDLSLTGFDTKELDQLLKDGEEDSENQIPAAPEVATSAAGDLWLLGPHRVLCGDSTSAEAVARLLGGARPLVMVTDPPYGVEYDPEWRAKAGVNKNVDKLGKVENDNRADWRDSWALFPGDVMYVWHAGRFSSTVQESIEACGFSIRSQIIWAKDRFALSRGHYHWQHEPCWYAVRGSGHWNGDRSQSTLWAIPSREDGGHGHGTQKPVECMRRPILNHTKRGELVYDPFLGSGTTLVAAEANERICFGLELDPKYMDVIVQRWQTLTGEVALLEGDGRTFDQISKQRGSKGV